MVHGSRCSVTEFGECHAEHTTLLVKLSASHPCVTQTLLSCAALLASLHIMRCAVLCCGLQAMDLELDGTGFGLGKRSQRYAAVIEDGVVSAGLYVIDSGQL